MSNLLIGQLMHEQRFDKAHASRVAMFMNLAEAGRSMADAARVAGLSAQVAGKLAVDLKITFKSNGPA